MTHPKPFVTAARQLVDAALKRAHRQLPRETATLEIEISPDAMLYIDVLAHKRTEHTLLEIADVVVLKDTWRRACSLPNIAEYIGRQLDKKLEFYNTYS